MQARSIAINTGILYARLAITVFISLYATRLILRALGAEDFGLFNVVGGAITMLTFLNTAMAAATQRFMSFAQGEGDLERQKNIFNVSIILHLVIALIVILLLEVAGHFLFRDILDIPPHRLKVAMLVFQFMIASTFFAILSVPYDAVINAHENMLFVAILGVIEAVCKLLVAIYISKASLDKLIAYGFLMAILSILLLGIRQIYCHIKYSEVRIKLKKYYSKPLFKEMTGFAGWSFLGTSSSMFANYGQGIVINMFFGTIVNAAQGIANQVSGQLGAFAGTLMRALNPMIVKSEGAGKRSLMLKASLMGSKTSFFLLIFFYIPVILEMPLIFKFWLKDVPEYAVIFCRLLLLRNLIEQLYTTLGSSIGAVGNIRKFQIYNSILNLLPLALSYFLFRISFPPYAIYIVFIFYSILSAWITIYFAKRNCGLLLSDYFKEVISRCGVSILIIFFLASVPLILMPESINRLFLVTSISTISFVIIVWFMGFSQQERERILRIFKSRDLIVS